MKYTGIHNNAIGSVSRSNSSHYKAVNRSQQSLVENGCEYNSAVNITMPSYNCDLLLYINPDTSSALEPTIVHSCKRLDKVHSMYFDISEEEGASDAFNKTLGFLQNDLDVPLSCHSTSESEYEADEDGAEIVTMPASEGLLCVNVSTAISEVHIKVPKNSSSHRETFRIFYARQHEDEVDLAKVIVLNQLRSSADIVLKNIDSTNMGLVGIACHDSFNGPDFAVNPDYIRECTFNSPRHSIQLNPTKGIVTNLTDSMFEYRLRSTTAQGSQSSIVRLASFLGGKETSQTLILARMMSYFVVKHNESTYMDRFINIINMSSEAGIQFSKIGEMDITENEDDREEDAPIPCITFDTTTLPNASMKGRSYQFTPQKSECLFHMHTIPAKNTMLLLKMYPNQSKLGVIFRKGEDLKKYFVYKESHHHSTHSTFDKGADNYEYALLINALNKVIVVSSLEFTEDGDLQKIMQDAESQPNAIATVVQTTQTNILDDRSKGASDYEMDAIVQNEILLLGIDQSEECLAKAGIQANKIIYIEENTKVM